METNPNEYIHPTEERTSPYAEVPNTMLAGGLTKREYFAAIALQGLLATNDDILIQPNQTLADIAVLHADNLIESLNKEKK